MWGSIPFTLPRIATVEPEALYLQHLDVVSSTAFALCRRNGVDSEAAEDFVGDVRLKLCEDDFAIIRKFGGRSSLPTFLRVVIANLFRDYRISKWGKWRPSAQAQRLGERAMHLERLISRDGYSFDAACHILEQRDGQPSPRAELRRLLLQLPARSPRRQAADTDLEALPASDRADSPMLEVERDGQRSTAEQALRRVLERLPAEDRLIVSLLYFEGLSVADVARGLGLEQKPLYLRIQKLLRAMAVSLEAEGVTADLLDILRSE